MIETDHKNSPLTVNTINVNAFFEDSIIDAFSNVNISSPILINNTTNDEKTVKNDVKIYEHANEILKLTENAQKIDEIGNNGENDKKIVKICNNSADFDFNLHQIGQNLTDIANDTKPKKFSTFKTTNKKQKKNPDKSVENASQCTRTKCVSLRKENAELKQKIELLLKEKMDLFNKQKSIFETEK